MPLYEVVILENPTRKDEKDGKQERVVMPPTCVVAKDEQAAAIAAVLNAKEIEIDRDRMEVLVRPF